jgi:hydrogenase/urease accessory protein HupE
MFQSLKSVFHKALLGFACFTLLGPAVFAHATGNSKTAIRILDNDSIMVEIDVNSDELVYTFTNLQVDLANPTAAQLTHFQQLTASYMLSHVLLQVDRRPLDGLEVVSWKPGGSGPEDDWTRNPETFWSSYTRVLTFGGRLPPGAKTLKMNVQLFQEMGMSLTPISEVSVYWRDSLIERKWLGIDKAWSLPISRDSLDARLASRHAAPTAAEEASLITRFIWLGYTHILPYGIDHILFVLGLFFFSTRLRPLFMQITAFTIAHSITLGIAMVGIFKLSPAIVEPLIALSIAVVGIENVFFRRVKASRWLVVFAFGLIHGMGFAGVLSDLGLPEGRFWSTLLSFNVGVELGQISVVAAAFALTFWMRKKSWYFKGVVVPVSLVISAVGLYWAVQRAFGL